ncbi:unnamed protein product [Prunus armeniaca]
MPSVVFVTKFFLADSLQTSKILPVQRFPDLHASLHFNTPCNSFLRLPIAKRATRETADRLGRFPAASRRRALQRARRHAFENTGTHAMSSFSTTKSNARPLSTAVKRTEKKEMNEFSPLAYFTINLV